MNEIFGHFFNVDVSEMFEPVAYAQSGAPRDLFIFDDQLHMVRGSQKAGGAGLRAELAAAAPGLARRQVLETFVSGEIQSVLGLGSRTLDPDTPLRSLGFDSLLSIELGSRLESALGIRLGQKFVWTHPTVAALTDGIAERLESELTPVSGGGDQ